MKRKLIVFSLMLGLLLGVSGNAFAYITGASYTWNATQPGYNAAATLHTGTISPSLLVPGDFLGQDRTTPNAIGWGRSDGAVGWDDAWTSGGINANANGDFLDGLWVQIYSNGGWWDMGSPVSRIAVSTSQDHGPYLGEGLEYRVYATNTLWDTTTLTSQILVSDVYLDGWRTHNAAEDTNGNRWLSDDITGVYNLGGPYRYVFLTAWSPQSAGDSYYEPEIDAVCSVIPAPGAILLGSLGVGLVGWLRRRRTL